jgi:carboxylesterase type B
LIQASLTFAASALGAGPPPVIGAQQSVLSKTNAISQSYWTNFAKSGDPNGQSLPAWPRHDSVSQAYLEFTDVGPVEKTKLRADTCRLYDEALEKR